MGYGSNFNNGRGVVVGVSQAEFDDHITKTNYVLDTGFPIATFDDFANWVNTVPAQGNIQEDRTFVKSGTSALRLNVTTAGSYVQADKDINVNLKDTNKLLSMWVYFHDVNSYEMDISLFNVVEGKYFVAWKGTAAYHKGWNLVTVPLSEWNIGYGTPSWNENIVRVRVLIMAKPGTTCSVTVDDMRFNMQLEPKIIFRFDDGLDGIYANAYPIMAAKGITGITYANSTLVGTAGYCTLTQLTEMYAAGWDIGNHTDTHTPLGAQDYASTTARIKTCQDWLIQNGFYKSAKHFAVPNGQDTEFVQAVLDDIGVLTSSNSVDAMFMPTMDMHKMPAKAVTDVTPVATVTGWIDQAVSSGRTLVLMFHDVHETTAGTYEYSTANFQAVVDYLYNNGYIKHVTNMSDYYIGLNR